ncbi:MAG: ABC transporter ATP-binding protein [Clostridia bacterium]|nr:ABC transporter ATP-binding protein [Clostridia bacterium]
MSAVLETRGVTKSYEGRKIIDDISVFVNEGEMVSLLGVSGIGKTTLFNIASGLEMPDEGSVYLEGTDVTGRAGKVGYMQQNDLLLPFKTVLQNVAVPLILSKVGKKEAYAKAKDALDEFALGEYANLYPAQLSGGMRQRAALARTFLYSGKMMLLDEPFSALDAMTRSDMQKWFKRVVREHNAATLFITHDVNEAILLSDRIYIMSGAPGRITSEIKVDVKECDDADLSEEFIAAKKRILGLIRRE